MSSNLRRVAQVAGLLLFLPSLHLAGAKEGSEENEAFGASLPEHLFDRGRYEVALSSGVLS